MSSIPHETDAGPARVRPAGAPPRAPYSTPRLEVLGSWSALTLQQSVPIGPNNRFLLDLLIVLEDGR